MAPRKTVAQGGPAPSPALEKLDVSGSSMDSSDLAAAAAGRQTGTLATDPLPDVRVNKANLAEIKGALDDIVKEHLRSQAFTPSLLHPTVHLSLGYASILLSLGGVLYTFRMTFEDSKPVLWIAVVGYMLLQSALWAWKRWVEKGEVFRGRRKRVVKRIETDHLQITSAATLDAPIAPTLTFSPHSRPSSPSQPVSPTNLSSSQPLPSTAVTQPSSNASATAGSTTRTHGPSYVLTLSLSTTSNNGKSLLHRSRMVSGRCIGEFIDEAGGVEEGEVTRWLSGLLADAGLVGAEDEGIKAQ